jgi:hypothetical protein
MKYLLLIYSDQSDPMDPEAPESQEIFQAYNEFTDEVNRRGIHLGSNALQAVSTATTVRVRDDEVLITDGPFAETKEQLGGYYLVDCADLDEALEVAAKIPGARSGSIEVRPIWEIG